jgi:hypothetical protein
VKYGVERVHNIAGIEVSSRRGSVAME